MSIPIKGSSLADTVVCHPMNSAYFLRQRANANNRTNDTKFEDNQATLSSYSFSEFLRALLKAIF